MSKRQTVELITPSFDSKIRVVSYMEKYYLENGYYKFSKNKIIKIFYNIYFSYFSRIIKLIKILKNSKFIFANPLKKDLLIYDCENTRLIESLIDDINYGIISVRLEKIKNIYISKKIFLYLIKNLFKASIKQNYIASIIKIINPKLVITNVDNSDDFHVTCKILKNSNIKFIAVQCAHRTDTIWKKTEEIKKIFIPEYFCFSDFDKKIHQERNCNITKYSPSGSLGASLALQYVKSKKIEINPTEFDICLISEPMPHANGDYGHVENFQEKLGKIAEYTYRLAKEKNLKVIFSGKSANNIPEENYFYKHYLKEYNFTISPQKIGEYSTYVNMMKSKIIIGHVSTSLREAFVLKKKVLSCNLTGHKDVKFPSEGICTIKKNSDYEDFKERVLLILNMSYNEYTNNLSSEVNHIIDTRIKTSDFIREQVIKIINLN